MMIKAKQFIGIIRSDQKARKNLFIVSLAFVLILVLVPIKNSMSDVRYVIDKNDSVVSIEGSSEGENISLMLEIIADNSIEEKDITITRRHPGENEEADDIGEQDDSSRLRNMELNSIISEIEASGESVIELPNELSDGSTLRWHRKNEMQSISVIVALMYVVIALCIFKDSIDSVNKPHAVRRQEVLMSLPRMVNQIVMMMDAGMILSDAIDRIGESYSFVPESQRGYLESSIVEIVDEESIKGTKTEMLHEFARKNRIKEMVRITTILLENERRGNDARDNLRRESEFLWESRKIIAGEKGKMIDTKMAMPLGLLLILLIVITMAPALMSM